MGYALFDTHAHYDDEKYNHDREALLGGLPDAGIVNVVNIGYDIGSSVKSGELASRYSFIWFAAGIHPHDAASAPEGWEGSIAGLLKNRKAVALGEIGLDYHYDLSPRDVQKDMFARQLALSGGLGTPVIIHDRDAHADIIDILKLSGGAPRGGVCHCFSGDRRLAGQALDLGLHIAFGGALTFKNAGDLAEAAAFTPPDRLLIETDCPYMSPAPYRGRRNDSTRLTIILERLAQIRGESPGYISDITTENAKKLFSIE